MARITMLRPTVSAITPRVKAPPKSPDSFYTSPEWRALVREVKRERGSCCQACGAAGRVIGDHVVEIRDGGAKLAKTNVMLLCSPCHNTKTAKARRKRVGG